MLRLTVQRLSGKAATGGPLIERARKAGPGTTLVENGATLAGVRTVRSACPELAEMCCEGSLDMRVSGVLVCIWASLLAEGHHIALVKATRPGVVTRKCVY